MSPDRIKNPAPVSEPDEMSRADWEREWSYHTTNFHLGHYSDFCDECQRLIAAEPPTEAPRG